MTSISFQKYINRFEPSEISNLHQNIGCNKSNHRKSFRLQKKKKKQKRQFIIGKYAYVSAGIIFYKIINGIVYYLIMKKTGNTRFIYEDLGGKISDCDECIEDIAAREASEESNAVLVDRNLELIKTDKILYNNALNNSIVYIKNIIEENNIKPILYPQMKYAVYLVPFPEANIPIYEFGDIEIVHEEWSNSAIERTFGWYNEYELNNINIKDFNPRIRILINDLINK